MKDGLCFWGSSISLNNLYMSQHLEWAALGGKFNRSGRATNKHLLL